MSLNQDLDDAKKKLEELRKEYEKLTLLKAPKFDIGNPESIDQINAAIETMNSSLEKAKKKSQELETGWGGIKDAIQASLDEINNTEKATTRANKAMRGVRDIARELKEDQQGLRDLSLKELKAKQDKLKLLSTEAKEQASAIKSQVEQYTIDKNGNQLSGAALESKLKRLKAEGKITEEQEAYYRASKEGISILNEANDALEKRIKKEKEILNKTGLASAALKSLSGFLSKAGMSEISEALGLDDATKKMRELAKDGASSFAILKGGLSSIGGSIKESLSNPLTAVIGLFGFLYKNAMDADKYIGDMAKGLSVTYDQAQQLNNEFAHFAAMSNDVGITQKGMSEALTQVNAELGLSAKISNEQLGTMEKLNRYAGLNYKQQAEILRTSVATGENYEDYIKNVQGTIKLKKFEQGLALNEKKVMLDINAASDRIKLSIKGGGEGLANAAVEAAKLGVSLGDVEKIADSLLNFEQSIEKELNAELLTGKDLNLEKARSAALNNDMATVAEEITKQAGSAAKFAEMSRIQQEAMAEAVGMTADQLGTALVEQEALKSVGKALNEDEKEAYEAAKAKYGAEKAAQKLKEDGIKTLMEEKSLADERQAQQEKFQAAIQGLAAAMLPFFELLSEIANVLIPLISIALEPIRMTFKGISGILSGNVESLSAMEITMGAIGGLTLIYLGYMKAIKIHKAAMAGIDKAGIVLEGAKKVGILATIGAYTAQLGVQLGIMSAAMATNAAVTFGIGVAVAVAAAAAGYAAVKALTADDMMSQGQGSSGYGKRTLFGPEGAIQLNNKDTVIAGTNLFGDDTVSEPGKSTKMGSEGEIKIKTEDGKGMDMSSVVNAISALGAKIEAVANRPINVNADGKKIIEATTNARPIESGEAVAKNSYKIQ
jgi:competence protein ComGC